MNYFVLDSALCFGVLTLMANDQVTAYGRAVYELEQENQQVFRSTKKKYIRKNTFKMIDKKQSNSKGARNWHAGFVFISCAMVMVLHVGLSHSIGALFVDLMRAFNSTRVETAVIQSTATGFAIGSGVFTGALIAKIGVVLGGILGSIVASVSLMLCFFASSITYMIVCFGVFNGIGFSFVYISSSVALGEHIKGSKKLLFMSLQASGAGIGGMLYPYFIRYVSDLYGFRGAFLILGALTLNTLPGCFLWKKKINTQSRPKRTTNANNIADFQSRFNVEIHVQGDFIGIEKNKQQSSDGIADSRILCQYPVQQDKCHIKTIVIKQAERAAACSKQNMENQTFCNNMKQLWQKKFYILFICGFVFSTPVFSVIIIFMADIFLGNDLTESDVSLGFALINIMSTVARLIPGILLQAKYIKPFLLLTLTAVLTTVQICLLPSVQSRWALIILTGSIGIPAGMFSTMLSVVTIKLVGTNLLPSAMGILFTCSAVGQATAGPIAGYIRDVTGSYSIALYSFAAITSIGAVIFLLALMLERKKTQRTKQRSSIFYLTSF